MTEMLDGQVDGDRFLVQTLTGDLMRWLREQGQPTEGVEVLAVVPLLSDGDAAEYGVVLYRDAAGEVRMWTAWQYQDLWSAEYALKVLEARASTYERAARWTRAFVAKAKAELALEIVGRAPDVPPEPGDE